MKEIEENYKVLGLVRLTVIKFTGMRPVRPERFRDRLDDY